jgi:large subunit ribosomal protein L35
MIHKKWLGASKFAEGSRRLTSTNEKRSIHMPKMKTKSSAKKRFRVRPGGTVKRGQAFKRHILTKKTTKNKRQFSPLPKVSAVAAATSSASPNRR